MEKKKKEGNEKRERFRLPPLRKHEVAFTRWESGGGGGGGGRTASSTRAARRLIAKSGGWQDRGTCHAIRE